jgi:hypothetical protein
MLRPAALFRGDLIARGPLMVEAEVGAMKARDLRGVLLDAWLTDLALASGHRKFFESFCRFVHGRFHAAAGFETRNLGLLLMRLREWNVRPDLVVGPVNPPGLMMKPSADEVIDELARSEVPVLANEIRAGGVNTLADGIAFARARKAYGLAPDLTELDDVGAELRGLKG